MSAALKLHPITVDEYLAGELVSAVKHDYLGGFIYAMAGARNQHNLIATNIVIEAGNGLRGKKCRAYNSDTKVRIRSAAHTRFYYPDALIVCRPNPMGDSFQDEPAVIFEVVSRVTRRIDEGEKKDAYLTIPTLTAYVLVEQELAAAVVHRRTEQGFVREVYEGIDAVLHFSEVGIDLPLSAIYEGVELTPEPDLEAE